VVVALGALVAITVGVIAADASRPSPTNLQLTPGRGTIRSSWSVSSRSGLTGFRIRWRAERSPAQPWGAPIELGATARAYLIRGLSPEAYEVSVRALAGKRLGGIAESSATPLAGKEEKEKPVEEEPPPHPLAVSPTPTGPPTPASGWSVAYADAFGAPIGTGAGHDNTFFPNNCSLTTNCPGFNSDEMEVMNPSAAVETAEGLKLTCTYTATAQSPGSKHYICGTLRGQAGGLPGYSFFKWSPGKGQTLVFQAVAKFPPNTGEADPGWWSNGPPWNDTEVDFFEGGGAGSRYTTGWKTNQMYTAWFASPRPTATKTGFETDPSQAFHTYTFELKANNTYSVWIDGVLQPWATNVGPATPDLSEKATLILSYALRTCGSCTTGFTSGTREFDVKSVAVYEDAEHQGIGIENGGVAPGTVLR
jgi:hypothetical protein